MKRISSKFISAVLALTMIIMLMPMQVMAEDSTGVTWSIENDVVTVTGSGELPANTFQGNTSIKQAIINEGITIIGGEAFKGCSALTSIDLPDSVTKIGGSAFADTGLKSLKLPDQLQIIDEGILSGTTVTSLTIPNTVTKMSGNNMWKYGALNGSSVEELIFEEGIKSIPNQAALSDSKLKKVVIPDSVTTIEAEAFKGCSALTSIDLPDSVTKIGGSAFADTGLKSLKLPDQLQIIDEGILSGTTVTSLTIPNTVTKMSGNNMWKYGALNGSSVEELIFEEGIKSIPNQAALSDSKLKKVVIPDSVTTIEAEAFKGCSALTSIDLPDSVTKIGGSAFADTGLKSLKLPDQLQIIDEGILSGTTVTSLTIPNTVTKMSGNNMWKYGALNGSSVEELIFEEGIKSIPYRAALSDSKLKKVVIPDSVTTIEAEAFHNCTELKGIHVPVSVKTLGNKCFDNTMEVYTSDNSVAAVYCIDNNIPFFIVDKFTDDSSYVVDYNKSSMIANINGTAINDCYKLEVPYAVKDKWKLTVSDLKIVIRIPNNTDETIPIQVNVDGKITDQYTYKNNLVTIPVSEKEGTITINAKVALGDTFTSYAMMTGKKDKESFEDVIAIVNEKVNGFTLNVPETVTSSTINVSGTAPAAQSIDIYLEGEKAETVTASKAGNWSAELKLPNPEAGIAYEVKADCTAEQGTASKEALVLYEPGLPEVIECKMDYTEHNVKKTLDMLETEGKLPRVWFEPGTPFDFTVKIDNDNLVDKVYITSTRNKQKRYLEAVYDKTTDTYKTNGTFSDDPRYVPGIIGIEYVKKQQDIYADQSYPYLEAKMNDYVSQVVAASTELVNDKNNYHVAVSLDALFNHAQGISDSTVDFWASIYDAKYDGDLSEWMGLGKDIAKFAAKTQSGEEVEYFFPDIEDYSGKSQFVYVVHEISSNKYLKYTIKYIGKEVTDSDFLQAVSQTMPSVAKVTGMYLKQQDINKDMDALREEVLMNTSLSEKEMNESLDRVEALRHDETMFTIMTTLMPMFLSAALVTTGGFGLPFAVFSGMLSMMSATAPVFWELRENMIKENRYCSDLPDVSWNQIKQFALKWVIDPSGYVYDDDTKEPLSGVTTTAYYIAYDGTDGFWDSTPAESEYGSIWNSTEYDQENPMVTTESGKYAWDVPEGWWRVKYEKDGYETTWSEWMPVPPIQTEVNVGMKSTSGYLLGDVNNDKSVDAKDLTALARHLAKIEVITDSIRLKAADVNKDDSVTAADLTQLAKYIAKIISAL